MLKWAAPAALLAVFFLQSFLASRVKSPAFDEPAHIAAGLSYVSKGVFHANPQHPPLMKELSGIGMLVGGIRWLATPTANDIVVRQGEVKTPRDWDAGKEILTTYGFYRTLLFARFPMILTGVLLGALLYLWAREMLGQTAALGALFLFALDPSFIAHSAFVTTDVGLAAFSVAFCFALWKYMQAPTLQRQIWCGVALGCALGAKYSGVFLLPIGAALLWFSSTRRSAKQQLDLATIVLAFGVMCLVALVMVELFYAFRATPLTYLEGLGRVNADHDPNYLTVLGGEAQKRFPLYFVAAWLLKEPIATVLLCVSGVLVILKRKNAATMKAFVLLPPAVLLAVHSLWAENLGIRYVLAAMPFLYLAGGAALAWLVGKTATWARVTAVTLCAWVTIAAGGIYPDHLAYFNETACVLTDESQVGLDGGSRCGPFWLDDSNVDWGQGLKQLKAWLDVNGNGRAVHLVPFGSIPPEAYGIAYTPPPAQRSAQPELYIFSGHMLARLAITDPNVRRTRPMAVVGHSLYVYP